MNYIIYKIPKSSKHPLRRPASKRTRRECGENKKTLYTHTFAQYPTTTHPNMFLINGYNQTYHTYTFIINFFHYIPHTRQPHLHA